MQGIFKWNIGYLTENIKDKDVKCINKGFFSRYTKEFNEKNKEVLYFIKQKVTYIYRYIVSFQNSMKLNYQTKTSFKIC